MIRYVACQNEECVNKGAPYHDTVGAVVECPVCGKPMETIGTPVGVDEKSPSAEEVVAQAKFEADALIRAALERTDLWVLRAVEDGKPLGDAKKAYRQTLRDALRAVGEATTRADIQAAGDKAAAASGTLTKAMKETPDA